MTGAVFPVPSAFDSARSAADLDKAAERLQAIYLEAIGEPYPRPAPQVGQDAASSLNNRAVSLLDLGKGDEALALWDKALALHPSHPESTYNRGMLRWRSAEMTDVDLLGDMERSRMQHERNYNDDQLARLTGMRRLDIDPTRVEMGWIIDYCAQALRNIIIGIGGRNINGSFGDLGQIYPAFVEIQQHKRAEKHQKAKNNAHKRAHKPTKPTRMSGFSKII